MSERFRALKTGPLELALDGADLRYVRFAGTEIVRRLYPAVRDEAWGTPAPALEPAVVSGYEDRIEIRVAGSFRHEAIALDWTSDIEARASGLVRYRFRATAVSAFAYNRFGLCLLQPLAGVVGQPYRLTGPAGEHEGTLTEQIGPQAWADGLPQPLVGPFSGLEIELAELGALRFRFEGDLFELEDQRNWTDASYKTYGPQLALGFPQHAVAGQRFEQIIEVEPAWTPRPPAQVKRATVTLGQPVAPLPPIGLALSPDHDEQEHDRIRLFELGPAHLRVDVAPGDLGKLTRADALAKTCGAGLEVALRLADDEPPGELLDALAALHPAPVRVLLLPTGPGRTPTSVETTIVPLLRQALPGVPLLGGTASHLVLLNDGTPLELGSLDGVAYCIDPQVHASDESSIMETLEAQGDTVRSARALASGRPVSVGPIALRNRELGPDPRQASSFCAAWTLGTINALARAEADSISIFETAGPGSTGDERGRFPVHAALAALGRRTGETVIAVELADPLTLSALATRDDGHTRVLLANSRDAALSATIAPLAPGLARVRDLFDPTATPYEFALGDGGVLEVALPAGGLLEIEHEAEEPAARPRDPWAG
jgi:D-apionolactonase